MPLDPISAGFSLAQVAINKIWPDKTEQEKAELAAAVSIVNGQLEINKVEAANPNVWSSGWRPYIGWVCGTAFAWNWIGLPVAKVIAEYAGYPITLSAADMTEMMPVLLGMLGLGAMRSYDKTKGTS